MGGTTKIQAVHFWPANMWCILSVMMISDQVKRLDWGADGFICRTSMCPPPQVATLPPCGQLWKCKISKLRSPQALIIQQEICVCLFVCLSVCLSVSVQTMKYLLNLLFDFHETLRAVFLGHLKLKSRVSKKIRVYLLPFAYVFLE